MVVRVFCPLLDWQYMLCNIFKKMYQQTTTTPIKDEILKSYIQQIFSGYDTNKSGKLDPTQMTNFFNDLFRSLNLPLVLNAQQSLDAIKAVYPSYNGTVNRDELFTAFKVLLGLSPMPQQPVTTNFANYPGMVPNTGFVGMPNNVSYGFVPQQSYLVNQAMMRQGQQGYPNNFVQGYTGYQNGNNQQFNGYRR